MAWSGATAKATASGETRRGGRPEAERASKTEMVDSSCSGVLPLMEDATHHLYQGHELEQVEIP